LRPDAIPNAQFCIARAAFERGAPFAVAAVEDQNIPSVSEPQHPSEVMRLAAIDRDGNPGGKRHIDVEPGGSEIIMRHDVNVVPPACIVAAWLAARSGA
jgi:hypothetical protein